MTNFNQKEFIQKSRNLTANQLFDILQEEYIVCELRAKIYPESLVTKDGQTVRPQDYWKSLMDKKKEKITDIARKNNLFSIFDDDRIRIDFDKKIIPEIGYPKFIYVDDRQRLLQEKWDRHNYYLPKTSVKIYNENGKILIGIIESVNFARQKVQVNIDSLIQEFDINIITRIL